MRIQRSIEEYNASCVRAPKFIYQSTYDWTILGGPQHMQHSAGLHQPVPDIHKGLVWTAGYSDVDRIINGAHIDSNNAGISMNTERDQ